MSRRIIFWLVLLFFLIGVQTMESQQPKKKSGKKKKPTVTSQTMTNSPGGIQATGDVTVNRGLEQRRLSPAQESQFVNFLKANPKGSVDISCIESGGPEPCSFARQLATLMQSNAGWTVNFAPIIFGAGDPTKTIPEIYILVRKGDVPMRAAVLQTALKNVGINVEGIERDDVGADYVQLMIWHKAR